jgi:hypothetical protein
MKAMLWRILYAALCVFMFWLVFPLFLSVIGFHLAGDMTDLMRVCIACIAVLYVLFGPEPPMPW